MLETIAELARSGSTPRTRPTRSVAGTRSGFSRSPRRPSRSRRSRSAEWPQRLDSDPTTTSARASTGSSSDDEPELAVRLAETLWLFRYMHGHVYRGRRWLDEPSTRPRTSHRSRRAKVLDGAGHLARTTGGRTTRRSACSRRASVREEVGALRRQPAPPPTSAAATCPSPRRGTGRGRGTVAPAGRGRRRLRARDRAEQLRRGRALALGDNKRAILVLRGEPRAAPPDRRRIPGSPCSNPSTSPNTALLEGDTSRAAAMLVAVGRDRQPRSGTNATSPSRSAGSPGSPTSSGGGRTRTRTRGRACGCGSRDRHEATDRRRALLPRRRGGNQWRRGPGSSPCRCGRAPPLAPRTPTHALRRRVPPTRSIESANAACDPETWERASAEGRAMSLDDAAEYALYLG